MGRAVPPPKAVRILEETPHGCPDSEELSALLQTPLLGVETARCLLPWAELALQPRSTGSLCKCLACGRCVGPMSPVLPQRRPPCECPAHGCCVRLGAGLARHQQCPGEHQGCPAPGLLRGLWMAQQPLRPPG